MSLLSKIHNIRALGLTVVKTGKISGGINALFASYPDVWAALKPALDAESISVGFSSAILSFHGDSELVAMSLEVCDGATSLEREFQMIVPEKILNSRGSSVTNNAQRVANAQSYLKRTALIHFFGMSAGNEDEVERMMPAGDQTNIPGVIFVEDSTAWQSLTDGIWGSVMSPLHDGKLGTHHATGGDTAMAILWQDYPNHPALLAWAADWITSKLDSLGWDWADAVALAPDLPAAITGCDATTMRSAAKAIKTAIKEKAA